MEACICVQEEATKGRKRTMGGGLCYGSGIKKGAGRLF